MSSVNDGTLSAIIWPAYVGVLDILGAEPGDYARGQIFWKVNGTGDPEGYGRILVPKGFYTHLAFYHHPTSPLMCGYQVIDHPFDCRCPANIDIHHITKEDFTQLPTPKGFVLPVIPGVR